MENLLAQPYCAPFVFVAVGLIFFCRGAGHVGSNAAYERWGQEFIGVVTESGRSSGANLSGSYVPFGFDDS